MANHQKGGVSPLGAMAMGAIAGVGVGMAINSDRGRQKIKNAKDIINNKVEEMKDGATNIVNAVKEEVGK